MCSRGWVPVSVAELAAARGRPADSLYYHLRVLTRVGLVLGAGTRTAAQKPCSVPWLAT